MHELPARYEQEWGTEFWEFVDRALEPGIAVLDVGAGRTPTIPPGKRPADSHYVGLDVSAEELETAPTGSYDETVVAGAEKLRSDLVGRFDLIVSWQVMEHFRDLPSAAEAFHRYARENGWFVACLSGRNALFAIGNRILPGSVGRQVVSRLRGRPLDTVFPAHYDHCTERGLREAFSSWGKVHVLPLWRGADYFAPFPTLRSMYVRYEDWAIERGLDNLATHYVVAARNVTGGG
jgi:SAM-dependent methyltransferase